MACIDDPLIDAPVQPASPPRLTPGAIAMVLIAFATGGFSIGVSEFAAMSVLPDFARGLGVDEPTAGHAISAYALGVVVGAPLLAVLGARIARWKLLIGFMLLFALGNGLSAAAPTFGALIGFRFLAGLPHGAFFGVAALVAASVVPLAWRTRAVSTMLLGLTIATVLGVPLATWVSQVANWRWAFWGAAALALLTAALVALFAPRDKADPAASPLRELGALRNRQVWLTLGIGAVGFGGMFSVYAYLASTLTAVTHVGPGVIPWVFAVFGVGMVAGNLIGGWASDRFGMKAGAVMLVWSAVFLVAYALVAHSLPLMLITLVLIGSGMGLAGLLQTRLMDVAGEAQTLAAALNHSAFNTANALGPFLAGMAVSAGYGWRATGLVGAALALGGLLVWIWAVVDARRTAQSA